MKSWRVMGIDTDAGRALQSQLGASTQLPLSGSVFISVKDADKPAFIDICRDLAGLGFTILAAGGTTTALLQVFLQHVSIR